MPTAQTLASHLHDITLIVERSQIRVAAPSADCGGPRGSRAVPIRRDADILDWLADYGRRARRTLM